MTPMTTFILVPTIWLYAALFMQDPDRTRTSAERTVSTRDSADAEEKHAQGFWPSQKLMRLMLIRWADDATRPYDPDEIQREKLREAVVRRWQPFFDEHRESIQPLINEFLEMRLGLEPPPKEAVQSWAEKMTPLFEQFRTQLMDGANDFRSVLRPGQRIKFEANLAKVGFGLMYAGQTLENWRKGEYNEDDVWTPPGGEGRKTNERRRQRRREAIRKMAQARAVKEPDDQIALEVDAWTQYVQDFAVTYRLDGGQRSTADSVLSELRRRALDHRNRHREEIDDLERRIAAFSGDGGALDELKKQLVALYGPIDEMFRELKRRIEAIPTPAQRAAAKIEPPNPKKGISAEKSANPNPAEPKTRKPPDTP